MYWIKCFLPGRTMLQKKLASEGEVVQKFKAAPKLKPPRRRSPLKNKTNRSDYSKEKVKEFREEGKDYQKVPDPIKELRREQRKRLKEKFNIQKVAQDYLNNLLMGS